MAHAILARNSFGELRTRSSSGPIDRRSRQPGRTEQDAAGGQRNCQQAQIGLVWLSLRAEKAQSRVSRTEQMGAIYANQEPDKDLRQLARLMTQVGAPTLTLVASRRYLTLGR